MSENRNKTLSDLITKLSAEGGTCKPLRSPLLRALSYFLLTAVYIAGAMIYGGVRHDWQDVMQEAGFVFEMTLSLCIWISSIIAAAWLCVPDMRGKPWLKVIPYVLTFTMALWVIIRSFIEGADIFPLGMWCHCVEHGLVLASIPLAIVIFMGRRGTTTQPYHMAVMNALVASSIGWMTLRMSCSMDDVGHGFWFQFFPLFVLGIIVGLFARKLFKW